MHGLNMAGRGSAACNFLRMQSPPHYEPTCFLSAVDRREDAQAEVAI
jgi:hypothetical protein